MSAATEPAEAGIFDATAYDLPIPKLDGHRADVLRLSLGGSVELDLYDEAALAFLSSLKLGQELALTVTVRVASNTWAHGLRGEEQDDHVVHSVGLKAHSFELPQAE